MMEKTYVDTEVNGLQDLQPIEQSVPLLPYLSRPGCLVHRIQ